MKLTAFILLATCLQLSAIGSAQTVSLSMKNATIQKVFKEINKQTGYQFFYKDAVANLAGNISIEVKDTPLEKALDMCFSNMPVTFSIVEKTIIVKSKPAKSNEKSPAEPPQPIKITGTVSDEQGVTLPGVAVIIKGTKKGTETDANGFFTIEVPADKSIILIFSLLGFEPRELLLGKQTDIRISLKINPMFLNDLVVTGYQTLSKERSSGSFTKPDIQTIKERSGSMNILQRLDGLIAGLTVNNSPLASKNPLLIRGLTTLGTLSASSTNALVTNRNPLYVVDGIPIEDISSINPQDVADMTVLKDATSASIWGSRASNGVIVITTKKGTQNEKIKVQYDAFINFQGKPDIDYFPSLTSRQFIDVAKELFDPNNNKWSTVSGLGSTIYSCVGIPPHEQILYNRNRGLISAAQAEKSLDSLASIDNSQQMKDLFYRNASLMNHTVSMSGGGKLYSFYGSFAFTNTRSSTPGDKNNTFKINFRQDLNLNKSIKIYLITDITKNITYSKRNISLNSLFYPYQLFQDSQGNNLNVNHMAYLSDSLRISYQNRSRINLDYNPLNEREYGYTNGDNNINRVVGGVTINLIDGLKFEGTYGYTSVKNNMGAFDSDKSYLVRSEAAQFSVAATPSVTPVYYLPVSGGKYVVTNTGQSNWTIRNQFIYDKSWKDRTHQLTLLAGQEAQEQLSSINKTTIRGYNPDLLTYSSIDYAVLASGISSPVFPIYAGKSTLVNDNFSNSEIQSRLTSFYANGAYTFNKKYSFNCSWRIDQSNLFGIDKSAQNKPVWSVGLKWNMDKEKFIQERGWINNLSTRVTYGITGNSPAAGTASSSDIIKGYSSTLVPGGLYMNISSPANRKLTWESTKTFNLGIDFSILNNRLSGSIDLYSKATDNLIGIMDANAFTGYASVTGNYGNMTNKGIELSLSGLILKNKGFEWRSSLALGYNKNMVTQMNNNTVVSTGSAMITSSFVTGYPAFSLFSYKFAGLDAMGDPQIMLADGTITKEKNIAKREDVVWSGTYQPVWSGGFSNTFSYGGFKLNANISYNLGHVLVRDVNTFYTGGRLYLSSSSQITSLSPLLSETPNINSEFLNRWKNPGDENITDIPSYVMPSSISSSRRDLNYYARGDNNIMDASYIKLRDITFSYSAPESIVKRIKADNITLRIQLSNLMLWKANKYGIDPEFQNTFVAGIGSNRTMPTNQKTVTIGVNISF
ncbi:MAG: hypothetical protein A2X18_02935 [Bacteroidetes bacterium GWF2_40_14]|nr:MAG: hypothetical protein A2X18_02935 [Bacteroidetes bacterium GWF2_40_14]